MKTTSLGLLSLFSLIFVIILLPMHVRQDIRLDAQEKVREQIVNYDGALRTAVQDAAVALGYDERELLEEDIQYDSDKNIRPNKERALEAFLRTLYINFDLLDDSIAQQTLLRYIPAMAVIDYDGFWVYAEAEYTGDDGETLIGPVWHPKKPFAYKDFAGNSLSFTLDDYVYAYSSATATWHEGKREEVDQETGGAISLLGDAQLFEEVRRSTIVWTIQNQLQLYINKHNEYARRLGIEYTFTLPSISQEEWNNSINDVGIMAFIQGIPAGAEAYNSYAFGGGRLIRKHEIYGSIRDGRKVYYRAGCEKPQDTVEEIFGSEKEAAMNGYYPASCANGN
ncbi:hypothetical protein [Paenibacillus harenae]|uniref:F0F1-type ATP synthase n=1 Tax=Paenibacillus harenae TaxID=306543 RepID=A0ABT9TUW2_PAEHA|nr:hypothetical protein [Paenibacillus harenae]MDQ0110651.1 hypothetical protein [Paenibacillus harenae]